MKTTTNRLQIASAIALVLLLCCALPAFASQTVSRGVYIDSAGGRHAWSINAAHVLVWDNNPFVPVGGLFQVQAWTSRAPAEADFAADQAALARLKTKGITDVYFQPARGGLSSVKPDAIQRVLNMADEMGFTYGISINDGPHDPILAQVVRPGAFRQVVPEQGGLLRFPAENLGSALYFVVGANRGSDVVESGDATLVAEGARISVQARPGSFVAFLLPERIYPYGGGLGVPNLWDGFDEYRDTLLALFSKVKLGKGFRFFVDALPSDLALSDEFERIVPNGTGFAREWGVWLARRYKSVDNLQSAWAVNNREVDTFADATQLVPLWGGGKGVWYFYHRVNGKRLSADAVHSSYWNDLNQFKAESIKGYMNDLATSLKRGVADVPVVYRSRNYSALFTALPTLRGFDGIGIDVFGRGRELALGGAAYMYAQAADANKTVWLPVVATGEVRGDTSGNVAEADAKPGIGYPSRPALNGDLDSLREVGARAFYVDNLHTVGANRVGLDAVQNGDPVEWLAGYSTLLNTTGVRQSANMGPVPLFYPRGLATASPRPVGNGAWWLPTDRIAHGVYDFGRAGRAYSMDEGSERGRVYYMWNPEGTRTVHIRLPKQSKLPNAARVLIAGGTPGPIKDGVLTLTIGPDPVRIMNSPTVPFPLEAFTESYDEAKGLVEMARRRKRIDAGQMEQRLSYLKATFKADDPLPQYNEMRDFLLFVRQSMRPYFWIEAENSDNHSFDEIAPRLGASNNSVLVVGDRANTNAATATYRLELGENVTFDLWASATPDARITFRLDGQPMDEAAAPRTVGNTYADGKLVWTNYGSVSMRRGPHTLEMRVASKAIVDTIMLTRDSFQPNGATPPPIVPDRNGQ